MHFGIIREFREASDFENTYNRRMPIKILPPEVVSQIAAGEVVERPASVVKELMENSIDAGADSITIRIENAGRTLIRVSDDGVGIPVKELSLAVERHATSKLVTADELFRIKTLGFRGEALASIGSVSRLTITTCARGSGMGGRIIMEGGVVGKMDSKGVPVGTDIQVEDLFFNTPARLKFLKKESSERRIIDTLLMHYALAYPNIHFRLSEGEKTIIETAGDGDCKAILAAFYGVDVAREMLDVYNEEQGYKITGYISPVAITRSNRKEITFFINGRWVQDTPLTQALLRAYHTLLMVGRYPLAALFLEVPPSEVDVNVHPAKAEVRFRDQDWVFGFVQRSIRRVLLAFTPLPQGSSNQLWITSSNQTELGTPGIIFQETPEQKLHSLDMKGDQVPSVVNQARVFGDVPILRLIGQIGARYLVAEGPDGLYLIDQHAAHERVLFEKLMSQFMDKAIPSQVLLSPATVTFSPAQSKTIEEQLPILKGFGFEVDPFGPNSFQVRSVPQLFGRFDPSISLHALVDEFEEDETPFEKEIESKVAARVCKRLAVKTGQTLSHDEQRSLLSDLETCKSPRTCPHGRPTMIHLSVDMLDKQFGRKGAV